MGMGGGKERKRRWKSRELDNRDWRRTQRYKMSLQLKFSFPD
jgi:hypothetical protein